MEWYNEPPMWNADEQTVMVRSGANTDFWRKTHSGQVNDNGHFYFQTISGDFAAEVKFSGHYADLYDQAGLMVRVDTQTWMKCGVELVDGEPHSSVVVTRDFSDFSPRALTRNPSPSWVRVVRHGGTFEVYFSHNGQDFDMIRQFYLTDARDVQIGLMTASPTGKGFNSIFEGFQIRAEPR